MSLKKIAIVTGANRGLGYETALSLAKRDFKVIMADKANQTTSRNRIIETTSNEDVTSEFLDLSSFQSVRNFAENILKIIDHLDVLVNNAGVFCMEKRRTVDNLDAVMQINHLGPFLLTNLLEDLLRKSTGSRIIFVSSSGSFFHNLNKNNLRVPNYYSPHFISGAIHYYNTKLCNMISAQGFAHKLRRWNITSNSVHPGMADTNFLISAKDSMDIVPNWKTHLKKSLLKYYTRDAQDAAGNIIFLSTSDTVKFTSGKYFVNYQMHQEPGILKYTAFCRDIWNESERLVGLRGKVN